MDFAVAGRHPSAELARELGAELAATIDIIESHHEDEVAERVSGVVTAVSQVTEHVREHRSLRRPGHGAPPDAVMPAEGEEWPPLVFELEGGVTMRSQPSRYITETRRVPGTVAVSPVAGLRLSHEAPPAEIGPAAERRTSAADLRAVKGWLVDLEPDREGAAS